MELDSYGAGEPEGQACGAAPEAQSGQLSPLASTIEACRAAGLEHAVLPVIPADAETEAHLHHSRGKVPGQYFGGNRWAGMKGWTEHITTRTDTMRWEGWPNAGLCVRTAVLRAFDIDVEDHGLAHRLHETAERRIGPGALVRIRGSSPRRALLFRAEGAVRKRRLAFRHRGRSHAVELLGDGQQLVIAGRHPSGEDYGLRAPGLSGRALSDIPELSHVDLDALWSELQAVIEAEGGEIVQASRLATGRQQRGRLAPGPAVMREIGRRRSLWLPQLLAMQPGADGTEWRVSSEALGRDDQLQEALCFYPDGGIFDFGTERAHDPVSLACEFGHIADDGEIEFGGCPEYGERDGQPYAVVGEPDPKVRRPTERQALAWLARQLDGPPLPPETDRAAAMPFLAAAVGAEWSELDREEARQFFDAHDSGGAGVESIRPEDWSRDDVRRNAPRLAAIRVLDLGRFDELVFWWEISGAVQGEDISVILATEADRLRAAPLPAVVPPASPSTDLVPAGLALALRSVSIVTGLIDARTIPRREHVIFPRYPRAELTLTVSEGAVGKSTLALHDALIITTGLERILRGANHVSFERLHLEGPALVYDAEDSRDELHRRTSSSQRHHGVTAMKHSLVLWSGADGPSLVIARRSRDTGALMRAEGADLLQQVIEHLGVVYAAVGPFAGLAPGMNENDATDCNTIMQILADIARGTGACINVIHHTSKRANADEGDMNAARGSSAIPFKARSMVTLNHLTEDEARRYGTPFGDGFAMTYAKVNHGRKPTVPVIFRRHGCGSGCSSISAPRPTTSMR